MYNEEPIVKVLTMVSVCKVLDFKLIGDSTIDMVKYSHVSLYSGQISDYSLKEFARVAHVTLLFLAYCF